MEKSISYLFFAFFTFTAVCFGQNTYQKNDEISEYQNGVLAFEEENYFISKKSFEKSEHVSGHHQKSIKVYQLMNAIYLEEGDALEKLEDYLNHHPYTAYGNHLKLALANTLFNKKKIEEALEWYSKVDVKYLTEEEEVNYNYKLGFTYYKTNQFVEAQQYLLPLAQQGIYKDEANYYLANIAIDQKEYDEALGYFDSVSERSKFKNEIAYQRMVILFYQKRYNEVIKKGKEVVNRSFGTRKSELAKIVGESFFYLEEYENALPYLRLYKGKKNKLSAVDNYFLGFAYYKVDLYEDAVLYFNKITNQETAVAQNAHYHLADCYLEQDKKIEALNAFKHASEMDFDLEVKQDAFLNYAKLGYEIGNPYKSSYQVLLSYVNNYPNGVEVPEIKKLIVNSFLQAKDYDGAVKYYNNQKLLKDHIYYAAVLEKGLQLYVIHKYNKALPLLQEASGLGASESVKAKAVFWEAETLSELNNQKEAGYAYRRFVEDFKEHVQYPNALYGYAYSFYQQKKYKQAAVYFTKYLEVSKNDSKRINSILRLGDCNYVNKQYQEALKSYNKIIDINDGQADYALYQKALSYGFLGKNDKKIEYLQRLQRSYPASAYADKSYYQLGNLYTNQNKPDLAIKAYNNLIKKYRKSALIAKAQLKKGLIYYNEDKSLVALNIFKNIVKGYPGTAEAVQSVKVAKQVYKDLDRVTDYASWVKGLEFVNISDSEIDRTMFEAVEARYLANNFRGTVVSSQKYLINFPEGIYVVTVNFYLAQSYYHKPDLIKASTYYEFILGQSTNEYTDIALNTLAQIYMEQGRWEDAFPLLLRIENEAISEANVIFAQSNLMRYYADKKENVKVLDFAKKVLNNPQSTDLVKKDAYLLGARSAIFFKRYKVAKEYYKELERLGSGKILAEAHYYKALWLFQEKKYNESNEQIQYLTSKYQQYRFFGVKGLLLMAQNYHALKDNFQATFILKNIIENAKEYQDVVEEAKVLLNRYEPKEEGKNTNETEF